MGGHLLSQGGKRPGSHPRPDGMDATRSPLRLPFAALLPDALPTAPLPAFSRSAELSHLLHIWLLDNGDKISLYFMGCVAVSCVYLV